MISYYILHCKVFEVVDMFWIFDISVCIPNNQFEIYELTLGNHIRGFVYHHTHNDNQTKDNSGFKKKNKEKKVLIKISNAHLILRLHLLRLPNSFRWWWWCWWVQLILFFIFSPPLQVDGCHLYAHLTPHHNLISGYTHTQLFLFILSWY